MASTKSQSPDPRLPESHRRWLAEASDVELCRALIEERQEFLPAALEGVRLEVERRELDPERVLRAVPRRRRSRSERRRYLYGGLVLASLGLIPALLPRTKMVEVLIYLDNPGTDTLRVTVADDFRTVAPDSFVRVPVRVETSEVPLVGLLRRFSGSAGAKGASTGIRAGGDAGFSVPVVIRSATGTLIDRVSFGAAVGARAVLSLKPGTQYALTTRRYRVRGRVALPDGEDETALVTSGRRPWDLDSFLVDGREISVTQFETPFPAALEMPRNATQGGVITLTRLARH